MDDNNQMPGMPKQNINLEPVVKNAGSENLNVPSHEETKLEPSIIPVQNTNVLEDNSNSEIKIPIVPNKGIAVVATRKGVFKQQRLKEGDKFVVKDESQLGSWMKCIDPILEQERIKKFKKKKANN